MALDITPTSGAEPFTLTIDLLNKFLIDGDQYRLDVRVASSVGSCTVPASSPQPEISYVLLNQGYFIRTNSVPVGNCVVYKVDIVDVATSDIISTQSVQIDNI